MVPTASSEVETEMEGSDEGDGVTDSARHGPEKVQRHRTKRLKMRIRSVIFMVSFLLVSAPQCSNRVRIFFLNNFVRWGINSPSLLWGGKRNPPRWKLDPTLVKVIS
jgi:hypothetical protein